MGFYLDLPEAHGKALQLRRDHAAEVISMPKHFRDVPRDKTLVCVVQNPTFDAAAICFDHQELLRFALGLYDRPVEWLLLNTDEVIKMKPHLAEYLRGERNWRE